MAAELLLATPLLPRGHGATLARLQGTACDDDARDDLAVILHFEPLDLFVGVNTVLLRYRSVGGNLAAEVVSAAGSRFWRFESNAEG